MNQKLDEIIVKLNKLHSHETKIDNIFRKLNEELGQIKKDLDEVKKQMESDKKRNIQKWRKNNIVVFGFNSQVSYKTLRNEIFEFVKTICDVQKYDIENLKKLNYKKKDGPIRVSFTSGYLRNVVLRNKYKLNQKETYKHIKIKEYLTVEEKKTREELFPFMIEYKKRGHKVLMIDDKLLIDGELLSKADLKINGSKIPKIEETSLSTGEKENGKLIEISLKMVEGKIPGTNSSDMCENNGNENKKDKKIEKNKEMRKT